ncbi:short-chain dehydrogenase/reductase SDR [Caballeronia fortuita]|uniref:Short-chain dehydrogenase/reductase SDR n=1 Tax=Caballeronia fortuita TaxID=1777138 RepID=A0A158ED69_9BURK|nr:SDR family oxidoreductase [Caballeronia fortuita]SAL03827.1 short-chain dehydrogenase/reductase SDR [Caballeronia fortuita]
MCRRGRRAGRVFGIHYNASKAALEGLTRGYAARRARDGIAVNAVAPGPIDTEMAGPLKASSVAEKLTVGRPGEASEAADVVTLLVRNAFIPGQTIRATAALASSEFRCTTKKRG